MLVSLAGGLFPTTHNSLEPRRPRGLIWRADWHLEGDLATVQGKLAETTSATTELAGEVDAEQARILAVMEKLDPLYDELRARQAEADALQRDITAQQALVDADLREANEMLRSIQSHDVVELKTYTRPPLLIGKVMHVVLMLVGEGVPPEPLDTAHTLGNGNGDNSGKDNHGDTVGDSGNGGHAAIATAVPPPVAAATRPTTLREYPTVELEGVTLITWGAVKMALADAKGFFDKMMTVDPNLIGHRTMADLRLIIEVGSSRDRVHESSSE